MFITKVKQNNLKVLIAIGFFIIIAIICMFIVPFNSEANSIKEGQIFSDTTIVTEDNIVEILDSLQIEHGELEKSKNMIDISEYTVGDLKTVLNKINLNDITKEIILEDCIKIEDLDGNEEIQMRKDKIINKTFSQTEKHDGYELEYSINARYNKTKKKFIETTGQNVDIDSDLAPIIYKITKKDLSSSCTSSKATLKANITVVAYIGVGDLGLIKVASQKIKSNVYWNAK